MRPSGPPPHRRSSVVAVVAATAVAAVAMAAVAPVGERVVVVGIPDARKAVAVVVAGVTAVAAGAEAAATSERGPEPRDFTEPLATRFARGFRHGLLVIQEVADRREERHGVLYEREMAGIRDEFVGGVWQGVGQRRATDTRSGFVGAVQH